MLPSRASDPSTTVDDDAGGSLALFEEVALHGDQPQADRALRLLEDAHHREAWAQAILAQVDNLVIVIDERGVVSWVSPSVERILGFTPDEVVGCDGFELLHPDDIAAGAEALARVRPPEEVDVPAPPVALRVRQSGGGYRTLSMQGTNLLANPSVRGVVLSARDVTERLAAQDAVAQSERRFRALVQHSSDVITLTDVAGAVRYSSPAVERILGLGPGTTTESILARLHRDDVESFRALVARARGRHGPTAPIEVRLEADDGSWRWLEIVGSDLSDDPDVGGVILNGRDVTDRHAADEALLDETTLLEAIARGESLVDVLVRVSERIERAVPGAAASVGVIESDGVIRHPAAPSLSPDVVRLLDAGSPNSELGRSVRGARGAVVFRNLAADSRWGELPQLLSDSGLVACWCWPVLEPGTGEQLGLLTVFLPEDRAPHVTELPALARAEHLAAIAIQRARFESRLEYQALHDSLTGLPNRTLLLDRIEQALSAVRDNDSKVAVLFIDIDRFKVVNDSLGHAAGDELLDQVARRFEASVRRGDTVGRFGGDEFVVCAQVADLEDALALSSRLLEVLEDPVDAAGAEVFATCSIGIAIGGGPDDARRPEAFVRDADAAMYRAKDQGRNQAAVFESRLHRRMVRRFQLERDLRIAVAAGHLRAHYQPRVHLSDGRLSGVEALLRWERPGHGLVGADQVIPVAEETGLIVPIGAWMLREACREAASWRGARGLLPIAVNLSARQLAEPDLVELVARTLRDTGLPPGRLCLEVTESALAVDPDQSVVILGALKLLGVRLAIDDFGTGYATLDYVRRFSMADELKIDRSFVEGVADASVADAAIISAVILLAGALGLETVAEGVEDREQVDVLRRLGCTHAQGYYFAQPVPASELHDLPTTDLFARQ